MLECSTTGAGSLLRTPDGQRVVVDVRLSSHSDSVLAAVKAAGATVVNADYDRVAVSVRPQDLTAVGDVAGVLYVGEEITPRSARPATPRSPRATPS